MPVDFDQYEAIPEAIRSQARFAGSVTMGRSTVHFDCAEWSVKDGVLCLKQALLDTSDRYQGILLKPRWTYLEEFYLGGNCHWTLRPLNSDET